MRRVTAHQREVLAAVIVTGSYKEAAAQLGISENAVRNSLAYTKLALGGGITTFQLAYLLGYCAGVASGGSYTLTGDA